MKGEIGFTIDTQKAEIFLCDMLKQFCGGMDDHPEYYKTEYNAEAQAVMYLSEKGYIEIISGSWPETRYIKFNFTGKDK